MLKAQTAAHNHDITIITSTENLKEAWIHFLGHGNWNLTYQSNGRMKMFKHYHEAIDHLSKKGW